MPIKQFGTMNGVAYQVSKETEGSSIVWRFRFDCGDGSVIPIELRGDDVRGNLTSGDRIEISVNEKDVDDTAIRLKRIANLTTGYNVQVWDKSAIKRIAGFISDNIVTAAIAALVTAGTSFLLTHLGGGSTNNTAGSPSLPGLIINPVAPSEGQVWTLYAILAALFDVVVFIILYWQFRRANKKRGIKRHLWPYLRRGRMLAILGGLLAGELLAILILWLTHTTV